MTRRPGLLGMLLLGSVAAGLRAGDAEVGAGRAVYHGGRLGSGAPLRGVLGGDVEMRGAAASCARCHRPSGYGSTEGALAVPPITGPSLFQPRLNRRADMIRGLYQAPVTEAAQAMARTPRDRPAYTDKSLAALLRTGVDPAGRTLDPLMPRYDLGEADLAALIAHLRSLSATPDPGVDERTLHLATVVSAGVAPARRRALLAVLEAFVQSKNLDVRRQRDRPSFSPHFKGEYRDALREWSLHVWELNGPPDTWSAQLDAHQRRRPVFAIVSGLVGGGWRPVHEFSMRSRVPCLFPATDLPVVAAAAADSPTVYLSRGLVGEAEALAAWLSGAGRVSPTARIAQVYRPDEAGETLARSFRGALRPEVRAGLVDHSLPDRDPRGLESWCRSIADAPPTVVVFWLPPADLAALPPLDNLARQVEIYASAGLLDGRVVPPPGPWAGRAQFTYPYALPGLEEAQIFRARAWLRSRKVEGGPERLQLNAFLAMSVIDHALARMFDHFSREYLIECVEHEVENGMNPGLYPRLSLGPGQRFASKGCYLVRPPQAAGGELVPVSPWIVP